MIFQMNVLIGTGFYATEENDSEKVKFLRYWFENTERVTDNIVVVDNSDDEIPGSIESSGRARVIRCRRNVGHACGGKLLLEKVSGWSLSWIMTALVAYADGCDFVYKEQDCLAFGNWLPRIAQGGFAFGRNWFLPCEQSLFWIRHDHIMPVIIDYLNMEESDATVLPEAKFAKLIGNGLDVQFHDLPGGRDRPLPTGGDFYAQRLTAEELQAISNAGLL